MTPTLRRELREKFLAILGDETLADTCADAVLEVRGMAMLVNAEPGWQIAAGLSSEKMAEFGAKERRERNAVGTFEAAMGVNPWPWWSEKERGLRKLLDFLLTKPEGEIRAFGAWSNREFSTFSPDKARQFPERVIENWPRAQVGNVNTPKPSKTLDDLERMKNEFVPGH